MRHAKCIGAVQASRFSKAHQLFLLFLLFCFSFSAQAQEEGGVDIHLSKDGRVMAFIGAVTSRELIDVFKNAPSTVEILSLNSLGGRADIAIELAKIVRNRGWTTYVDMNCVSACTMIFMGGVERVAVTDAYFVFHLIRWYDGGRLDQNNPKRLAIQKEYTKTYIELGMDMNFAAEIEKVDIKGRASDEAFRSVFTRFGEIYQGFENGRTVLYSTSQM